MLRNGTVVCKYGGCMEGKRYDLIPGGLVMEKYPSNNESQEVSRGRSSEEVTVMVMEQRTEQIYQLLKLNLYSCMALG